MKDALFFLLVLASLALVMWGAYLSIAGRDRRSVQADRRLGSRAGRAGRRSADARKLAEAVTEGPREYEAERQAA